MGAGDDIIAIASIGAEILLFLAEAEERAAQKLGLTVEERRKMREDAFIAAELTKAAAEVVTQTLMDIEKEQLRKRTNVKRVRIHGYSRV
jgi:branched-subunit amino acid aminotransferase/4-amino-4-deoxychorismate lyase